MKLAFFAAALLVTTCLPFFGASAFGAPAFEISLKDSAGIMSEDVFLGDIADIRGGDEKTAEMLKSLKICVSPLPGKSRSVKKSYIKLKVLRIFRTDGDTGIALDITGPEKVEITRNSNKLDPERLKEETVKFIGGKLGEKYIRTEINILKMPDKLSLPAGEITFDFSKNQQDEFYGKISLSCDIIANGEPYRRVNILADVRAYIKVYRLKKDASRGAALDLSMVEEAVENIASVSKGVIKDPAELAASKSATFLSSGTVLTRYLLDRLPDINRGDDIKILVKFGNVTATTYGKALQEGSVGELIKIRNSDSKKDLVGKVVDKGVVEINY